MKKHCCCKGYEGGFVERLKEGTYLAHVMEHIALELQAKLGYDIRFGKTRETGKKVFIMLSMDMKTSMRVCSQAGLHLKS